MTALGIVASAHVETGGAPAAAPTVAGTPTTASSITVFTSISVNKPTGTTVGETLVLYCKVQSTGTAPSAVTVSGSTFTARANSGTGGVRSRVFMWDRVVDGSEPASFTLDSATDPNRNIAAICFRLTAPTGVTFDAAVGGGVQGNTPTPLPALTTTAANCLVAAFAGVYTGPIDAALTGYTSLVNIATISGEDRVWTKTQAVAGSAGTPNVTAAPTSERIGMIVASWKAT